MKVMLLKDVYKLGRAGEVKKVANGFGRNYLLPQGLAVLATPGALASSDRIRQEADVRRAVLNEELGGLAELLNGQSYTFPVRASETGKLYGSVTTRMIAAEINEKLETELSHRQIDSQPIRYLGEYQFPVRLTIDLAPEVTVIVYREGLGIESAYEAYDDEDDGDIEVAEVEIEPGAYTELVTPEETEEAEDTEGEGEEAEPEEESEPVVAEVEETEDEAEEAESEVETEEESETVEAETEETEDEAEEAESEDESETVEAETEETEDEDAEEESEEEAVEEEDAE
jgi:large subunit ribosomal protein L9